MLLESKHLQSSQINPQTLKTIKSNVFEIWIHLDLSKKSLNTRVTCFCIKYTFQQKKNTKKHLQQPNVASDTSNTLQFQNANPSRSTPQPQSNQIIKHFTCMRGPITYWKSIGLRIRMHKKQHIHKNLNNAENEMVLCSPCFAFYCFSFIAWFIQTFWDNSYQQCGLILTLLFLMPFPLHFYWLRAI